MDHATTARKTTTSPPLLFQTRLERPKEERVKLIGLLNERLADTLVLFAQTKQAHWNVKGNDFYQLHLLFDSLAEIVEEHVDEIAERVTALGGVAQGTVHMAATCSTLPELETPSYEGMAFVEALSERYAQHAKQVREAIDLADEMGDKVTSDLLTEIGGQVEKALYFLESHVQRAPQR